MSPEISQGWPEMSGWGEAAFFGGVAAFMVLCALGVLFLNKAAYAVISMVGVMLGMALLFFALEAPFNGAVQIIVYTGAILMLFLFVIMMIGLGASDEYLKQRYGPPIVGLFGGMALAGVTVGAVLMSTVPGPGKFSFDSYSNVPVTELALNLFQNHWLTIQITATLLIVAAVGAVFLTHSDHLGPKLSQRGVVEARMKAFFKTGSRITQSAPPGVFSSGNAVDNPAIDGATLAVAAESVPRVLKIQGLEKPMKQVNPEVYEALCLARTGDRSVSRWGNKVVVEQSKAWGMGGADAPTGLVQICAEEMEDKC